MIGQFWSRESTIAGFLRYLAVGGVLYLTDFICFFGLYTAAGVDPQIANIAGKAAGAGLGFVLHKYVTYLNKQPGVMARQAAKYAGLVAFNLLLSVLLVYVFIDVLRLPVVAFRVIADFVVIVIAYCGMRIFVFRNDAM